jgi:Ca2+-transporting ATPase
VIFSNIRKFVFFLLSGNIGEILAVGIASLSELPLPILPLQILFINLLLDVFPAMALGIGEGSAEVMERPPRNPKEPIMQKKHWFALMAYGSIIAASILGILWISLVKLRLSHEMAVTHSFLTLGFARLLHVFNMRESHTNIFRNEVTQNPYIWGALALCASMLLAAVYIPGLSGILNTQTPDLTGWALIFGFSILPLLVGQMAKAIKR